MVNSIYSKLLSLLAVLGFSLPYANAQFSIGAEVRPRAEYRHGFKKLIDPATQKPAFFVEQRSRLYFNYKQTHMTFRLSLQDVRIWGSDRQIYKPNTGVSPNITGVHEAWGQYYFNKDISLKIGRQELNYDNARFLGNLGWAQQSRSHDAALLIVQDSTQQFHIGTAFNQDAMTPEYAKVLGTFYRQDGNYKTMQYLWYHKNFVKGNLSALIFNDGKQAPDSTTNFSQTFALIGNVAAGKIKLGAEAYYQTGKDAGGNDLSAYLFAATASAKLGKVGLTIGGDYVSGTPLDAGADINNSFNPFYGTNHKFYGLMDYFYVGNPSAQMGKTVGVIDPYIKTSFPVGKNSTMMAHFHHFLSPVKIYANPESQSDELPSSMGTEIDLVFTQKLKGGVLLQAGYSQLFATQTMQVIKGGDKSASQNWAWLMISFKPTLFRSKS